MATKKKQTAATYSYRPGSRVSGVAADVAGNELERIRRGGSLTAAAVVAESEPDDAPLHPAFEWDDGKAAHEYRLGQARNIIRCVCVTYAGDDQPAPRYVHVNVADDSGYHPVDVVVKRPDLLAAAMGELQGVLQSASRSVEELRRVARQAGKRKVAKAADDVGKHLNAAEEAMRQAG